MAGSRRGCMSIMGFLLLVVVGAICGGIAEMIVGYSPGGFLASVVVGFVGAWIGGWLAVTMHLPSLFVVRVEGHSVEIVWTVIGAIALLLLVSLGRRSTYYSRWRA
jgi:uncharacterized membrane protein YeaQ/YmgE (transglycosylase-associated protein family)